MARLAAIHGKGLCVPHISGPCEQLFRHCERSQVIQLSYGAKLDCFAPLTVSAIESQRPMSKAVDIALPIQPEAFISDEKTCRI
jgi:hypothetical protein